MVLNRDEFGNKVLGCWMGKNIGGTLGAPMEWKRQVNNVTFYTQELGGEPLPNDDLDIQLLWLIALEERGIAIDSHTLADYWQIYVTPHWCEYGTAKANLRAGLLPPLSGTYGNDYKDSCGAFIRSEIWACIAPGEPRLAAAYAYEDGILDHGNGDGTYAEVFCAALESAAFVEKDIHNLIEIGLSYIPESCGVAKAVKLAVDCYRMGIPWQEARDKMLENFRGSAFFGWEAHVSAEDMAKGFFSGQRGWDAPSNIGMLLIGLLYGNGDFAQSLCIAVNCGEDTDCTAATAGSIFGIIHGIEGIPEEWIAPIGRKIKTACLNLGELGYFGAQLPQTVDDLTDRTVRIAEQLRLRSPWTLPLSDAPTDLSGYPMDSLRAGGFRDELYWNMNGPVFKFGDFTVGVDYGDIGPVVQDGSQRILKLRIKNTYKIQVALELKCYAPEGWTVTPAYGSVLSLPAILGKPVEVELALDAESVKAPLVRMVVEITIPGRPETMLVPITLLNRISV